MPTVIGQPFNRIDGPSKVTGRAAYAADHSFDGLVYAYGVMSTVAAGEIERLDIRAAENAPGVLAVYHHGNFPLTQRFENDFDQALKAGEARPPFEGQKIYYAGQFVALVVAESLAQARAAARAVEVFYRHEESTVSLDEGIRLGRAVYAKEDQDEMEYRRGSPEPAFADAPRKIDAVYRTPAAAHNPMELHATTAHWIDGTLVVYDSTQWVIGQRKALARRLGLDEAKVIVRAPFVGGGFGGKLFLWPHTVLAAVGARELRRPVRLMLTRHDQFTTAGHRPETRQQLRLGATEAGKFVALQHESISHTSRVDQFVEMCGNSTRSLYSCPNVAVSHRLVPLNVGTPTAMRAPGAAPGLFALESAIDELAVELAMDPIALRRRNLPLLDEDHNRPWSSNHLAECYRLVEGKFGWWRRIAEVGAMRDGREVLGWGFATAFWPSGRDDAKVRVELRADGSVQVACATQDIGTGTYTVFAQVVAELTTRPIGQIEVVLGDSTLPPGPISGGSMVTATVVPAIAQATRAALKNLFTAATLNGGPFAGTDPTLLAVIDGMIVAPASGVKSPWGEAFPAAGLYCVVGEAEVSPPKKSKKYSFHSFGAHCVEVGWDPGIARLRVRRMIAAIDAGQIVNHKMATNQVLGSLIMGLGMALQEEMIYDGATGRVVNDNLADYHMPVHADLPELEVTLLNHPDPHTGEFGVKGIGEIGITGVTAAIANAVYHATGRRIRDLPITVEKLLA